MKKYDPYKLIALVLLLVMAAVLPVSAEVTAGSSPAATTMPVGTLNEHFISVSVSNTTPTYGDKIYITGVDVGSNLSAGIEIWTFAGSYIDVRKVPVNADNSFVAPYNTTGYPPAMYYVFAQAPGPDGIFTFDLKGSGQNGGQVVNTRTGSILFNFTGTGSIQDAEVAQKLSDAINAQGSDDVYAKASFRLVAPVGSTVMPTAVPTTAKSPLPVEATAGAVAIAGLCAVLFARKS